MKIDDDSASEVGGELSLEHEALQLKNRPDSMQATAATTSHSRATGLDGLLHSKGTQGWVSGKQPRTTT